MDVFDSSKAPQNDAPFLVKGSALVQFLPSPLCLGICHVSFSDSPFGALSECVAFEMSSQRFDDALQLFGFSSKPRLDRGRYALVDNSHFLIASELSLSFSKNDENKVCADAHARSLDGSLSFTWSVQRSGLSLPLVAFFEPYHLLGVYSQQRFRAYNTLSGTFHKGTTLKEEYTVLPHEGNEISEQRALSKRITEVLGQDYFSVDQHTFYVDEFSFIVPEPQELREKNFFTKKKVASNFACDS